MTDRRTDLREVPGARGYFVSPAGDLYSARRFVAGGFAEGQLHQMKPRIGKNGYRFATLTPIGRKETWIYVHVAMALAFHGPKPTGRSRMVVRHLDGNKLNNAAANLAWGTHLENAADAVRHGQQARGTRSGPARLNEQQVHEIRRRLGEGATSASLARAFCVSKGAIAGIKSGANWYWLGAR